MQSMLEESLLAWRRYETLAPELNKWIEESIPMLQLPEEERMEYFQVNRIQPYMLAHLNSLHFIANSSFPGLYF